MVIMRRQKHIIKRQIIDLEIPDSADAHHIQTEISRLYRQQIVPLIDRNCTAASSPDQIHRIESLEIDLGTLDPAHLEIEFVSKTRDALQKILPQKIREQVHLTQDQGKNVQSHSMSELFAFFMQTGALPWWADSTQPNLLASAVDYLLKNSPQRLRIALLGKSREGHFLKRLITHFADDLLLRLVVLLLPTGDQQIEQLVQSVITAVYQSPLATRKTHLQLRRKVWVHIFHAAIFSSQSTPATSQLFLQTVFASLASELKTTPQLLQTQLQPYLPQNVHFIEPLAPMQTVPDSIESVTADDNQLWLIVESLSGSQRQELWRLLSTDLTQPLSKKTTTAHLKQLIARLPDSTQEEMKNLLSQELQRPLSKETAATIIQTLQEAVQDEVYVDNAIHAIPDSIESVAADDTPAWLIVKSLLLRFSDSQRQELWRLLSQGLTQPLSMQAAATQLKQLIEHLPISKQEKMRNLLSQELQWTLSKETAVAIIQTLQEVVQDAIVQPTEAISVERDFSFSEGDELYVDNAGLVLLWPFLTQFFDLSGLIANKSFIDQDAMQRAVAYLQLLATGATVFPEYLLPLNKILCGMEPDAVFMLDSPLETAEIEASDNLLTAVISQVPILNNMSIPAFRGTFLLRHGVLRTRDGAWLLQVERETYDVVLDRFPWQWEWLKLPWMTSPCRVEW